MFCNFRAKGLPTEARKCQEDFDMYFSLQCRQAGQITLTFELRGISLKTMHGSIQISRYRG